MDLQSDVRNGMTGHDHRCQALRTTLAYSILLLGLAASAAAVPAAVWALANHGLR